MKERDRRQGPKYQVGPQGVPAVDCRLSFDAFVPHPEKYLHLLSNRFTHAHSETVKRL